MGALLVVTALAAQAATAGGTTPTAGAGAPIVNSGESNYLELDAGAGYSTNPLLSLGSHAGSGFGRISLLAVHSRVSDRSSTLLSAYAQDLTYTNHQGSQQSVSIAARHNTAISEHARLFVDANATFDENGQLGTRVIGIPILPPTPGGPVTPPILVTPNGDFLSVTGRTYAISGHAGGTFALGPRDSLSLSSGLEHVVFHSGIASTSFTTVPVSLAYDRQLTAHTSVGARVTAADTEYKGPTRLRVITPQLTARTSLSQRVTLDGAIGVSFARVNDGISVRHSTGLSAQVNLCGQGETSFYCAHFSVDQGTATTAGPARSIQAGVDYSKRLDRDQTIAFSVGVTRYSSPVSAVTGRSFSSSTYYRAATSYSRRFGSRLFGGLDLSARKLTQNGPDAKTDFSGSLFIRYRFGDIQ